jgi:hypothetical protein
VRQVENMISVLATSLSALLTMGRVGCSSTTLARRYKIGASGRWILNQPPTVLRAAVSGLKAQYESGGHRLQEAVNSIIEKKPRLRTKYKRPDPHSDRLYQTRVAHPQNDEASCVAVCGDDPSKLILRRERTEDEDNPTIILEPPSQPRLGNVFLQRANAALPTLPLRNRDRK